MTTRHWKLIQGFALAALLPLCATCNGEDDGLPQDADKQPVQVNITRATMDGGGNWTWANGDAVGLSINGATYTLTYSNGSWTPAITGVNLPATVQAWWPNTNNASASSFTYTHDSNTSTITTPGWPSNTLAIEGIVDQSTTALLAQSDWMTTGTTTIASPTANLTMQHRLCKVTVNIAGYTGWGTGPPTINEVRFFTANNNEIDGVPSSFSFLNVNPLVENVNGQQTYTAIVSAHAYSDLGDMYYTSPLLRLQINGTNLFASYSEELVSGNAYTFNLTVNNPATRSAGTPECELELVEVQDMNEK